MNLLEIGQFIVELILIMLLIRFSFLLYKQGKNIDQRHKLFYASATFLYSVVTILNVLLTNYNFENPPLLSQTKDWVNVFAIVLSLSALGLMIRQSKPKIARAPIVLAFIPFLILVTYPFVADTFILKRFVFLLLEVGGIFISILMYSYHYTRHSDYKYVLLFILLIGLSIGVNLFLTHLVLFATIMTAVAVYGLFRTYNNNELQF
jgi:hypothetical protein